MNNPVTVNPCNLQELTNKIERAFTVRTNINGFTGWQWDAYKVQEHEKDIILEAMEFYENALKDLKDQLLKQEQATKEETNDDTAVCE